MSKQGTDYRIMGAMRNTAGSVLGEMRRWYIYIAVVFCAWSTTFAISKKISKPSADMPIVFVSDYGTASASIGICKGTILKINPKARLHDAIHQIPPFSIGQGAQFLWEIAPYFPARTVFLVIVDAGSDKKNTGVIMKSKSDQYFVAPDNGVLSQVLSQDGMLEAREITNLQWIRANAQKTPAFGREVLCPSAALLSLGEDFQKAGMKLARLKSISITEVQTTYEGLTGTIDIVDPNFGNVVTNITQQQFIKTGYWLGEKVAVKIENRQMQFPYVSHYKEVKEKEPLLLFNTEGKLVLALNRANLAVQYAIKPGTRVFIRKKGMKEIVAPAPGAANRAPASKGGGH